MTPQDREKLDAYYASLSPEGKKSLRALHDAILKAAPGAVETFSYSVPAVRYEGRMLVYYAAWRNHCSLYPFTAAIQRAFARELEPYETLKGTIQFPIDEPIPSDLVVKLVKARIPDARKGR